MHEAAAIPAWVLIAYLVAGRLLHPRAARPVEPGEQPARQPPRHDRHGDRGRRPRWRSTRSPRSLEIADRHRRSAAAIGLVTARRIQMTAMPQLVAAFHSLVGMAAVLVGAAAFLNPDAFGILERRRAILHRQPGRNGAWRRDRRDHLFGLGHRLPQIERQHERSPILLPLRHVINLGTLARDPRADRLFHAGPGAVGVLDRSPRWPSPSASC